MRCKIEWENGPNADYDSAAYTKAMSETAAKPGKVIRNQGDVDAAFEKAKTRFHRGVSLPHLVQAAMEPLVAVARIVDGKAEVWAPIQSPYGARKDIADALKLPIEDVIVHVTLLGGGVRPQVEVGLHDRGGAHLAEARRHADAAAMDARGRYPPFVLPHDLG